jgi:citrate synthase
MMLQGGGVKIWRPRQVRIPAKLMRHVIDFIPLCSQIYVGPSVRDYVPVEERISVEGNKQTPSAVPHSG